MLHRLRRVPALVSVLLLGACHDGASPPPSVPTTIAQPAFVDVDLSAPVVAAPPVSLPGAVTSVDRRGAARFVWTHDAAPALANLAVTPALRARGATTPAAVAALWHAGQHAARWQLDADALASAYVARTYDLGHGAIVVQLRQRVDGIEVAHTSLSVVLDRDLNLVALSGGLHRAARPSPALARHARHVSADDAVARAFGDLGVAQPALTPLTDHAGWRRMASALLPAPPHTREVLYPVGDELVPAWETEIAARDKDRHITSARHVFAADDGRLLSRMGLTHEDFKYRVWADATGDKRPFDGPQGDFTPYPGGAPDGKDPVFVAPNLVSIDGFNHNPGGGHDPWLASGATVTSGNNVNAYADLDQIDGFSAGDVQPTTTAAGTFDRVYDISKDPQLSGAQQMAAVTQQFYVTNWLHDYWYDSGFNEAAGIAQASNFGRGGIEGDPLLAEGQDSSGTDNANMNPLSDGFSPIMQMFVFDPPLDGGPRRDGTIDNQVIEHEWGHYLHLRLVPCASQTCFAMSEGWADFDSLLTGVHEGDDLHGAFGMGGYVSRAFTKDAGYYGIRRYPYSIDQTKSPLTFRFVQSGVPLPPGVPTSDTDFLQGGDNWEVHNTGEIWAGALWEALVAELVQSQGASPRFSFEAARRRMADYVVGGMMAAGPEPTFTEQRDAILAVAAASDPTDFVVLANGFARRGFGTGAVSPDLNSGNGGGVVENFQVTGSQSIESITISEHTPSCDNDGIVDVGETADVKVTVRNVGAANLIGPALTITTGTDGLRVVGSATQTLSAVSPFGTASATFQVVLDEQDVDPSSITVSVASDDASAAQSHVVRTATAPANLDIDAASSATDDFTQSLAWTASSGWALRTVGDTTTVGVNVAANGVHALLSPALSVASGQHLTVTFNQRYAMPSARDGGVLEISTDGTSFVDVSTLSTPNYEATLADGPLAGRAAWTGTSPFFPDFDTQSLDLGTSFGGKTVFLRFRAVGDANADTSIWDIDSVQVGGISNTPFPTVVPETGSCLPGHRPVANAGTTFDVAAGANGALDGSHSSDADGDALTFTWTQLSGIQINLSSNTVAQPTFTAPATNVDRSIVFQLVVKDATGRSSSPTTITFHILGSAPPDAPPVLDGGVQDASMPPIDAPPVPGDAARADAATTKTDAGNPEKGDGGGCSTSGGSGGGVLLALGLAAVTRRRRRES